MLRLHRGRLTGLAFLLLLTLGCSDSTSSSGGGGDGGDDSSAGPLVIPGPWGGSADGLRVCFYVSDDRTKLTADPLCDLRDESPEAGRSFGISVDSLGVDDAGQACSFSIDYAIDVPIDPATGAFAASGIPAPEGDGELAFSGEINRLSGSGVAQWSDGETRCRVGWGATPVVTLDDEIVGTCLDLQNCCRATLVNPVFLETCRYVASERDQVACLELLLGYPQCRSLDF